MSGSTTTSPPLLPRLAFHQLLCAILLLFFSCSSFNGASATTIDVINHCPYPIWPGVQSNAGSVTPEMTGFVLPPGVAFPVHAPYSWSGRIWARTMCSVDPSTSNFSCATGGCASGAVACNGFGPKPPVSLAQFNLGNSADDAMDYYGISLADGFNLPLKVVPMGLGEKSSDCKVAECDSEVDGKCTLDNKDTSPHICPTAKTPSFKLVFCPVPVPVPVPTVNVNVTRQMPDGRPPMPRNNATTTDGLPSTYNNTSIPGGNVTNKGLPPTPASAPAPASSSNNATKHKDLPAISITLNFTISEPPSPAPAPAPASLGRRGFVRVSSDPAASSASTTKWLLILSGVILVALLTLVVGYVLLKHASGQ